VAGGHIVIGPQHLERLVAIEAQAHYSEPPPLGQKPFVVVRRGAPVLLSAPHGCRVLRSGEGWHQEEEYTAAMALLLAELCGVSVIATLWRTDDSDPNDSDEERSAYKRALREIVAAERTHLVIDLHGAAENSPKMAPTQWVDLGLGKYNHSLPPMAAAALLERIEHYLGAGVCDRRGRTGFPAGHGNRIRAFCRRKLQTFAVQVEMKPSVRVVQRRAEATSFRQPVSAGGGQYAAPTQRVQGMVQALVDFILAWLNNHFVESR